MLVGGGPAADGAAHGLREAGFKGPVTLISDEPREPYERPHLSKGFLTGEVPRDQLPLRPAMQYRLLGIDLRLGSSAAEIDVGRRVVRLAESGRNVPFDVLLIATGSAPLVLSGVDDALYLRRLEDAERLREVLASGSLDVMGAGFIGCEVAASARALGCDVRLWEALEAPLLRVLGPRLGSWLAGVHRSHGVELTLDSSAVPLGRPLLVAVGTSPRVALAESAGVACDGGVLVDSVGETSVLGVYAAGDCARYLSPLYGRHIRVEHFQTAWRHGVAVGRAMAGSRQPFAEAPWFWSDQYDLNLQYTGGGVEWDEEAVRGVFGEPPFTVFQLQHGTLVGALGVNDSHTISRTRRVLEARARPTREQLLDPGFDLRTLVRHH